MPFKVEKLVQSRHVEGRWYVELEDGRTVKGNVALIADFSLYPGRELTEEEGEALLRAAARMNAKARALRILDARMLSKRRLYERLLEKGEAQEDAAEAVDYLESLGVLDDGEYAKSIVRHYAARGYGERRMKEELYRRGIPRELWQEALAELPEDTGAIDALVARRLGGAKPDRKEWKRLTDMLLRRGYSWEEVREALARYDCLEEPFDG